jgi:uncharacterized membrane protein
VDRKPFDLILVASLTAVAVAVALTGVNQPVARALLTLPLVLVLPGYALVAAVFPDASRSPSERLLYGVGVSLAVAALGGFALNLTPWGLRADAWATLLGGVALVACAVAWARRGGGPAAPELPSARASWGARALVSLAALIAVGAVAVAAAGAAGQSWPGFTQFWLLPAETAAPYAVRVGVINREGAATRYLLRVTQADQRLYEESIALEPGGQREVILELADAPAADAPIEATLHRADAPEVIHRRAWLWPEPKKE